MNNSWISYDDSHVSEIKSGIENKNVYMLVYKTNDIDKNLKNVPMNKVITSFTGLRAVGNTGDFIINNKDNFINIAGIESPGLSASPAIAEYVVALIKDLGLELKEKDNYIITRKSYHEFKNLPVEEKNKIIKEKPEYGKIICRCEEVTLRRNYICNKSKSKSKRYRWNKKKNKS